VISPPETFDSLAKGFVLQVDHLKLPPEQSLSVQENLKHSRDKLLALPDSFKICQIVLKNGRYFTCIAG